MYFKQFYLGCLAHASYMIGSDGEAAVVDPRRDVDSYIDEARAQGFEIRHIIETHLHADFVSGHQELAHRTGAKIYFGAKADAKFDYVPVREGDEIRMGEVVLRFLETPGHTPESVSIVVEDRAVSNVPKAVLTGDTLFIGDVGRPDLAGADPRAGSGAPTAQDLAGMLYDSLHRKLLTLPDSVEVYPAHGAGSLCGRNISSETSSTIGQQRQFNYALKPMPKEEFVRMMTTDLPEAPQYFARDVAINRGGAAELARLPEPAALSAADVDVLQKRGRSSSTRAPPRSTARATFRGRSTSGCRVSSRPGRERSCRRRLRTFSCPRKRSRSARRRRVSRGWDSTTWRATWRGDSSSGTARVSRSRRPNRSASKSSMRECGRAGPAASWTCGGQGSGSRDTSPAR